MKVKQNSERLNRFLSAVVPEHPLPEESMEYFSVLDRKDKERIFSEGETVSDVHFLLSGIGRYFYLDAEGVERNKSLVRAGGAFTSISSIVEGSPSPLYAETITPCITASVPYSKLVELSEYDLFWATFIRRIYEKLVLKKERREAELLMLDAKTRYQNFLVEFGDESTQIPLRHVAMYLGITDVTLSRIRRDMGLT
ncbi:putative cAMP-binding protein [Vibrio nigripulchritudo SFn27]|uniref:Putative cAMP-binding protein n=1 Tax=Vibrio nigripulchritudo TaxID=28173 RepID=U4KED0_9VIBR|nr:Crp/Fnr family transcriptional regulator [Vibrio nigripulchritudo]CCN83054.1 putative cAMP-binding protein [Vibrio nigripulchritudo BLFn1]CCN90678.1 putative cAMP-binding protein [Vibrio nigripulchritudo SFn27]CCN97265.1 putative cAMP-binding protein [Vibrio nigripulchritudo ENn2]CCO39901.1 putative cAMP-binding protein [Vibrio nigripulchritudo SFn135]CCO51041.1 putative cAMP-binding protein [Vibrio nigripulchritudo Wn13]